MNHKYHISCYNSFPNNRCFLRPWDGRLLKTLWEKEKMMVTSIFSFSHNAFYPIKDKSYSLHHIYFAVCTCFQIGQVNKFVVLYRVRFANSFWKDTGITEDSTQ